MRNWLWAILGVAIWLLAAHVNQGPAPKGLDAPTAEFSAARARAVLARLQGPARPHPAGSPENAAIHARLLQELAAMGVATETLEARQCYGEPRWSAIECADITDIIATVVPGEGRAVILMAHMDSVPAGPGAGDDGAGTATILETIRALKAGTPPSGHPVIALFTDGEEAGLLGAEAFVGDPRWRAKVGVAINVEARGSSGQSLLFQTSPGDARLIDLYAGSAPRFATSSLYDEIYKVLPNDTDLTPFLKAGLTGYNFAFLGEVAHYHTALDTLANLDSRSLQSGGDAVLALTRGLRVQDFTALRSGNAIYLDVMGIWLPRLTSSFALPLALAVFAVIAFLAWRRRPGLKNFLSPLLFLVAAIVAGFALQALAAAISGHGDPAYARPMLLRLSLALGVWTLALIAARRTNVIAGWLWLSLFAVVTAAWIPGLSPYFLFPALVAALALPFSAAWLPAFVSLLIWIQLTAEAEPLMGLAVTPLFTLPAAMGLLALLPLLKGRTWQIIGCGGLSVILAVIAGFVPAYDTQHPQRLNFRYVEAEGRADWLADPVRPLPEPVRQAMDFSEKPLPVAGESNRKAYLAPAGAPRFAVPAAAVLRSGRDVTLKLSGSPDANAMMVTVPRDAGIAGVTIAGKEFPVSSSRRDLVISCASPGCRDASLVLHQTQARPLTLWLAELRHGLPPGGDKLQRARGALGVASQSGDITELRTRIKID
jgi:hypothetical protein